MIISLSKAELNQLAVQPVDRREKPSDYLKERDATWDAQMERVLARGGKMWNGEVYTLEDIFTPGEEQVTLRMSTCEYKDLVFRMLKGDEAITARYGGEYLARFVGVSVVPVTRDGRFVFGMRADRPEQGEPPIGGIGGTLNKDEMEIHSFTDIRLHMLHEIQEETRLECQAEELRFFGLMAAYSSFHFTFTIRLPLDAGELGHLARPGEFSQLVALTQEETYAISAPMSRYFRLWRPYLHQLPAILEGDH